MKDIINSSFFLLAFFLITVHQISAQEPLNQTLKALFESYYQESETAAVAIISDNNKPVFEYYHGNADLENKLKANSKTQFLIGSLTKQFTAAAILILEEQELLSTEDLIGDYLPLFKKEDYPVRIHHLLTHTAGIPSDNANKDIQQNIKGDLSPVERINFIKNENLLFTPGEQYDYSNNGYIMLGLIIEKVSGLSYADFLELNIFRPNDMIHTQVMNHKKGKANQAIGYALNHSDVLQKAPIHASTFSAGGIWSTPRDLNKWAIALFSHQILSKESLSKMLQNHTLINGKTLNVGYGWEMNTVSDLLSYEHSGAEPGYKCYSIFIPKKDIHVLSCQNSEEGSPTEVSIKLAALVAGTPYPDERHEIQLSNDQTANFTGTYLFNKSQKRFISTNDKGLYIMAPGGLKQPLMAIDDHTLIYSNGYRQLSFQNLTDAGYSEVQYLNRIQSLIGVKTSNQLPVESSTIELSLEVLRNYTGLYESEMFNMTISLIDGDHFAQPEGSDQLKLLAKAKNKFYIEEIGAEIEFDSIDGRTPKQIKILLEGQLMIGVRKID